MVNLKQINKQDLGKLLIPEKILLFDYKKELEILTEKLDFDNINYLVITNLFFLSYTLSIIIYVFLYPTIYANFSSSINSGIVGTLLVVLGSFFILSVIIYYLSLMFFFTYKKNKFRKSENEIEKDLPEFIDNLVSNLKGGISLEKALLKSVRKEQKALLHEVTLINEKVFMGANVEDALGEFRRRFDSAIINRTLFLIEEGIKGGGNLAKPLERISNNLKRIYGLNEEIKSNSSGFSIVISMITILVAPLLFALALTLLSFIGKLFELLSEGGTEFLAVTQIPQEFTDYLVIFSYAMIGLITFFSSLITSQLKNEKTYEAIKYVPLYILISLFLYSIFSELLLAFFGNII